jgi:hypothetical protein
MELTWQRARYREAGHRLMSGDRWYVEVPTLQRWLWRRLLAFPSDEAAVNGRHPSPR